MGTHVYRIHVKAKPGRVDVDNGRVQAYLNSEPAIARELMRRADRAADYQRRACPRRTGRLASTVRTQLARSGSGGPAAQAITGREGSTNYLGFLLYGTGPHVIVPNRAKALRFATSSGVVFATKVQHPGNRADNFVLDSLAAAGG